MVVGGANVVTLEKSTFVTVASLELPAGHYVVSGALRFLNTTATDGLRIAILATAETNSNDAENSTVATGRADLQRVRIVTLNATTTFYLRAFSSANSPGTVGGEIRAIRIN